MGGGFALWCLCILGLLKEFRPSEYFLTQYLVGPWKNITQTQVNQEIYPIGTYSTLVMLIGVFLITDILRYKPVIILHSTAGVICYTLITFSEGMNFIQAAEIFYGLFIATEVAYSTYIYTVCNRELYLKVTSYTRISLQAGRFLSGAVAQLLISYKLLNFHELNYLSLAGLLFSTVFACFLPPSNKSVYFHRVVIHSIKATVETPLTCDKNVHPAPLSDASCSQDPNQLEACVNSEVLKGSHLKPSTSQSDPQELSGFKKIWYDFIMAYSDLYVVKWSIWWALMQCGYLQVTSYIQNLWQDTVEISGGHLYNGAAATSYTVLGICATYIVGQLGYTFSERKSQLLLAICTSIAGTLIIFSALTFDLLIQYVTYGIFKIVYHVIMTLANSEVAKATCRDSHGLIFGFNTFIALALQTILTLFITGKGGFELTTRLQFLVYGGFFGAIGLGFCTVATTASLQKCMSKNQNLNS